MPAQGRRERPRDFARFQGGNADLDLLSELAPFQGTEIAPVLGAGVSGVVAGQLGEVRALQDLGADDVGANAGRFQVGIRGAGGHDEDVARVVAEAGLELLAVVGDVAIDLRLGHRDPE